MRGPVRARSNPPTSGPHDGTDAADAETGANAGGAQVGRIVSRGERVESGLRAGNAEPRGKTMANSTVSKIPG